MAEDSGNREQKAIHLRGHHFLCLLTYKGLGYTPGFVKNMSAIAEAISQGCQVVLKEGPDDICNALSTDDRTVCDHDCTTKRAMEIDREAAEAVSPIIGKEMAEPFVLDGEMVKRLRTAFQEGSIRAACSRCRWRLICDGIADGGYAETRLYPA